MRILEAALILANLSSLILGLKKQSRATWLGAAGVNLSLFLIHGVFEGFRYQMAFAYIFVILLVVFGLIRTGAGLHHGVQTPKTLKVITLSLFFVMLVFTSFLTYALPVFTLPKPTGSYAVGTRYFHLVDESRNDPFLDKSTKKRELMVKVYYPAENNASKPFSPYFHNSAGLIRAFTAGYGLPDFMFDHLRLVRTNSREALQPSARQPNYPVVLFSHGAGTTMEAHTSQCEDLASHGYIVVAIDHTYVSSATAFPDRIVSAREATTDFKVVEPAEVITQIMADDVQFVIGRLSELNEGKIDLMFKGKLNLDEIGVIGHSVGGAAAYNLAIDDGRVKAAIDLDGRVYITPQDIKTMAPFLMLANDKYHVQTLQARTGLMKKLDELTAEEQANVLSMYGSSQAYREAYEKDRRNAQGLAEALEASGNLFTIAGSDHMKFSDIGLFIGIPQLRELIGIGGKTDPARCLQITEAVTLAFFDRHLKADTRVSVEALMKTYPELQKVDLK